MCVLACDNDEEYCVGYNHGQQFYYGCAYRLGFYSCMSFCGHSMTSGDWCYTTSQELWDEGKDSYVSCSDNDECWGYWDQCVGSCGT